MQVLGSKIHVKVEMRERSGAIHLPATATDFFNTGGPKVYRVLGVGPKTNKAIRPGDRVLVHSYTEGPELMDDGSMFLTESQVLAVLPETVPTNAAT